jgi:hypothetical protein
MSKMRCKAGSDPWISAGAFHGIGDPPMARRMLKGITSRAEKEPE